MSKAKVLKVTKPDKTVHVIPVANQPFLLARNNILPAEQRWKIETIDEDEAKDVPFIDIDYVTGAEAVEKNSELKTQLSAKDQEILDLKRQLADANSNAPKFSATQAIALIGVAKSAEEVDEIAKGDDRVTVTQAAKDKKAELKKAQ